MGVVTGLANSQPDEEPTAVDPTPSWGAGAPRWLAAPMVWLFAFVLVIGFVGPILGFAGLFLPLPVIPLSLVVTYLLVRWLGSPTPFASWTRRRSTRGTHAIAGLAVAAAAVTGVVNGAMATQHVLANRDPGVYVASAAWLAETGRLHVDGLEGPFAERRDTLDIAGNGFYANAEEDLLDVQFLHLLPELMALGSWVAGEASLFGVNAVIGSVALLALYLFATRFLRPAFALIAVAALAVNMAQVHFTRDAFSEIVSQVLLFGGLWALVGARRHVDFRWSLFAGALIGGGCLARIDAVVVLVPLAAYLAGEAINAGRDDVIIKRFVVPTSLGALASLAVGAFDGFVVATPYATHFLPELVPLMLLVLASAGLALVLVRFRPSVLDSSIDVLRAHRQLLAKAVVGLYAAASVYGWFVRPHVEIARRPRASGLIAGLQAREGLPVDGTMTYAEDSLVRLATYMGPIALFLGLVGFAYVIWRALGRGDRDVVPFAGVFGALSLLYIWDLSIFSDQIWALRRFLPITIPGLAFLAALALEAAWRMARGRAMVATKIGVACAAATVIAQPARVMAPILELKAHAPAHALLDNMCSTLGSDVAAIIVNGTVRDTLPQSLQGFCGWEVAVARQRISPAEYRQIASEWGERGRRLLLIGSKDPGLSSLDGFSTNLAIRAGLPFLERTVERPPRRIEQQLMRIYFTHVPTADESTGDGSDQG